MKYLRPLIIAILQIFTLIALNYGVVFLFQYCFHYRGAYNVAWRMSIEFGIIIFALSVLFINYIWASKLNLKLKYCILLLGMVCFCLLYLNDLSYTPYKTIMFLFLAMLSFLSILFYRKLFR